MIATGFVQIPSAQPDLWRYRRPWNNPTDHHALIKFFNEEF